MARILVVDDDFATRDVVRRCLEIAGHQVIEAATGAKATAVYQLGPIDLVIIDWYLPDKTGVQTIAEIKNEFPTANVLLMSGWIAEPVENLPFLMKPFTPSQLLAVVSELLAR